MESLEPLIASFSRMSVSRIDEEQPEPEQVKEEQQPLQGQKTISIRWFKFEVRVIFQCRSTSSIPEKKLILNIESERFFQEGEDFLRKHISSPYLSYEVVDDIVQGIMSSVQEISEGLAPESRNAHVLSLAFAIVIDCNDVDVREKSMQEVRAPTFFTMDSAEPLRSPFYRISRIGEEYQERLNNGMKQLQRKSISIRWFNLAIRVIVQVRSTHSDPPTLKPITVMELSIIRECENFFKEGQDFLKKKLSNPFLSQEEVEQIIEGVISDVQKLYGRLSSQYCYVLPLSLDVFVDVDEPDHEIEELPQYLNKIKPTNSVLSA